MLEYVNVILFMLDCLFFFVIVKHGYNINSCVCIQTYKCLPIQNGLTDEIADISSYALEKIINLDTDRIEFLSLSLFFF